MESDAVGVDRISGYLVSDTMEKYLHGVLGCSVAGEYSASFCSQSL
ncbi:MAG: hypothetical protein M3278_05430 [Thermoproteota archaeon]|nr:hypothetical protein [Thermoproteota archaeon]